MSFLLSSRAAATTATIVCSLAAAPLTAQAVIRGVLYDDATGGPIRGTVMLVNPMNDAPIVHVSADSLGHFVLSVESGTYQLAAVREGYSSLLSAPIPLVSGERMTIRMPLSRDGNPHHRIGVVEHVKPDRSAQRAAAEIADPLGMTGFQTRRAVGTGLQFDRAALAGANVATLGEFLQNIAGVRILNPESTSSVSMSRSPQLAALSPGSIGACHVGWFVDGHRMDLPGQPIDAVTDGLGSMQLEAIEAVEVFRGISEMPPEFAQPDLRCGAVAIWTRH